MCAPARGSPVPGGHDPGVTDNSGCQGRRYGSVFAAMKTRSLRCIVRIDVERPRSQHCWEVKIIRSGDSFHRSFSDSKFGGKQRALEEAIKCRDRELEQRPTMSSFEQAIRPKVTNKSGIVGVRRTTRMVRRDGRTWNYRVWAVTGTPVSGGKSKTRYFSIDGMGERKARAAAIQQRKDWEESLRASVEARSRGPVGAAAYR